MGKIQFKDIPCVKDQAYFIMVGIAGSWMFDATYPANQDEEWCKHWVGEYTSNCGWDDQGIQEMIDDSYEDIKKHKGQAFMKVSECDCGTTSHAHHVNCPKHPGNIQ